MPTLKQMDCSVEWDNTKVPFKEYGAQYGDGIVECFIAIPEAPVAFTIHLQSKGYIAPGLAMFVYMDGVYQCNRNRFDLVMPDANTPSHLTEVDFRLRQKEERRGEGGWIGRTWRFENLRIVNAGVPDGPPPKEHFEDLGTIQVIVLRCRAAGEAPFMMPTGSGMPTRANSLTSRTGSVIADVFSGDGSKNTPFRFSLDGPADWGMPGPTWGFGFDDGDSDQGGNNMPWPSQGSGQQFNRQGDWDRPGPPNSPTGSVFDHPHSGPSRGRFPNTPYGSEYGGGNRNRSEWGDSQPTLGPSASVSQVNYPVWSMDGRPIEMLTPVWPQHGDHGPSGNWGNSSGFGNRQGNWDNRSNIGSQLADPRYGGAQHGRSQSGGFNHNGRNESNQHQNGNNGGNNWQNRQNPGSFGGRWPQNNDGGHRHGRGPNVGDNNNVRNTSWGRGGNGNGNQGGHPTDTWDDNQGGNGHNSGGNSGGPQGNLNAGGNWRTVQGNQSAGRNWGGAQDSQNDRGTWEGAHGNETATDTWGGASGNRNARGDWRAAYGNETPGDNWRAAHGNETPSGNWEAGHRNETAAGDWRAPQGNRNADSNRGGSHGNQNVNSNLGGAQANESAGSNWGAAPGNQTAGGTWGRDQGNETGGNSWGGGQGNETAGGSGGGAHGNENAGGSWGGGQGNETTGGNDGDWRNDNDANKNDSGANEAWAGDNNANNESGGNWENNDSKNDSSGDNGGRWGNSDSKNDSSANNNNGEWGSSDPKNDSSGGNQGSGWDSGNNDNSGPSDWGNNNENAQGSGSNNWNQNTSPSKPASIAGSQGRGFIWVTPRGNAQPTDEPPLYTVPEEVAQAMKTSHQVQPGQSTPYIHKVGRPAYMDTFAEPYARFIFRYRTKETIEQELGITIERDREEEKRRLATLSKDQIIDLLLGAQQDGHHTRAGTPAPYSSGSNSHAQPGQPLTFVTPRNIHLITNGSSNAPSQTTAAFAVSTPANTPPKSPAPSNNSLYESPVATGNNTTRSTRANTINSIASGKAPSSTPALLAPATHLLTPSSSSPTAAANPANPQDHPTLDIDALTARLNALPGAIPIPSALSRANSTASHNSAASHASMPGAWHFSANEPASSNANTLVNGSVHPATPNRSRAATANSVFGFDGQNQDRIGGRPTSVGGWNPWIQRD